MNDTKISIHTLIGMENFNLSAEVLQELVPAAFMFAKGGCMAMFNKTLEEALEAVEDNDLTLENERRIKSFWEDSFNLVVAAVTKAMTPVEINQLQEFYVFDVEFRGINEVIVEWKLIQ